MASLNEAARSPDVADIGRSLLEIIFQNNSCVCKLMSMENLQMQLFAWASSRESASVDAQQLQRGRQQTLVPADELSPLFAQPGRRADGRIVFAPHRRLRRHAADVPCDGGALAAGRPAPRRSRRHDLP